MYLTLRAQYRKRWTEGDFLQLGQECAGWRSVPFEWRMAGMFAGDASCQSYPWDRMVSVKKVYSVNHESE